MTDARIMMPPEGPPTAIDYEFFMLRSMVDAPDECVDPALRRLDADREVMESSYHRIEQQNYFFRPAFDEVCDLFGKPLREEVRESAGRELTLRSFPLRIWDDFCLEIYGSPDGLIWDERFVRASGSAPPETGDPDRLEAWSLTKDEVEARFGPLAEIELWSPYSAYSFAHSDSDGLPATYHASFSRSLLQRVDQDGT